MIFGYARVSTQEQNLDRQISELEKFGVDEIVTEKVTGTKFDRPELNRLMDKLRKGDVLVFTDLTRLSRSTKDLFILAELLQEKGVDMRSIKESWVDTTTPQGRFLFTITAGISQFERDLISQRTKEGLASARARGRLGGRKPKLDLKDKKAIYALHDGKNHTCQEICKMFGDISKSTMYNAIDEIKKLQLENKNS